jgi:hypothetical protein
MANQRAAHANSFQPQPSPHHALPQPFLSKFEQAAVSPIFAFSALNSVPAFGAATKMVYRSPISSTVP